MEINVKSYEVNDSLSRAISRVEAFRTIGDVYLLLYAALDIRLCIERTLFEYLALIRSSELPARLERLYSATDLKKAILREEPDFFKKLEFLNLFVQFLPYDKEVVYPDLDLLSRSYGRTNDYLHAPKRPNNTWQDLEWWGILEKTVNDVVTHLVQIHSGLMGHMNLSQMGEELFKKYISGEISAEDVTQTLEKHFSEKPPVKV